MRIIIIPQDKFISIDGNGILDIKQDLSWIPSNIHAVQWYNTWGELEYNDGTRNKKIEELGVFEQAIQDHNNEIKRIEDEAEAASAAVEAARDYWEELRVLRNQKLSESDWTQASDSPLTEKQRVAWKDYRQALRDLPKNITDPKPLVLDLNHPDWGNSPS